MPGHWEPFTSSQPRFCRRGEGDANGGLCGWVCGCKKHPLTEKRFISTRGRWCEQNQNKAQLLPPSPSLEPSAATLPAAGGSPAGGGRGRGGRWPSTSLPLTAIPCSQQGSPRSAAPFSSPTQLPVAGPRQQSPLPSAQARTAPPPQTPAPAWPLCPKPCCPLSPPLRGRAKRRPRSPPHRHLEGQAVIRRGRAGREQREAGSKPSSSACAAGNEAAEAVRGGEAGAEACGVHRPESAASAGKGLWKGRSDGGLLALPPLLPVLRPALQVTPPWTLRAALLGASHPDILLPRWQRRAPVPGEGQRLTRARVGMLCSQTVFSPGCLQQSWASLALT